MPTDILGKEDRQAGTKALKRGKVSVNPSASCHIPTGHIANNVQKKHRIETLPEYFQLPLSRLLSVQAVRIQLHLFYRYNLLGLTMACFDHFVGRRPKNWAQVQVLPKWVQKKDKQNAVGWQHAISMRSVKHLVYQTLEFGVGKSRKAWITIQKKRHLSP